MSLDKPLDEVTEGDLSELVSGQIVERRTLEYKERLPGYSDGDKKEFLADTSSFANSAGGHIIYGIRENNGVPTELSGLEADADSTILALESSIRSGLSPRVAGVHCVAVPLLNQKRAFVLRVPRSYTSPHMVTFKGTSRFYARGSNGKYQLDIAEIRASFLGSETIAKKLREFRAERINRVLSGEMPLRIKGEPILICHVVPLNEFESPAGLDLRRVTGQVQKLVPVGHTMFNATRVNFDGFLVDCRSSDKGVPFVSAYTQLYRNHVIEAVSSISLYDGSFLPGRYLETNLVSALTRYCGFLHAQGIEPPLVIFIGLLRVKDHRIASSQHGFIDGGEPIDRNTLILPEVLVEDFEIDLPQAMKPAFDSMWNASGSPGSPSYDSSGKWISQR